MSHDGVVRLLGYTRVGTAGQDARLQLDALVGAGGRKRDVFADVTSGTRAGVDRPGMAKLLVYAEPGDTIVVWRVDRLGRSRPATNFRCSCGTPACARAGSASTVVIAPRPVTADPRPPCYRRISLPCSPRAAADRVQGVAHPSPLGGAQVCTTITSSVAVAVAGVRQVGHGAR